MLLLSLCVHHIDNVVNIDSRNWNGVSSVIYPARVQPLAPQDG